MSALESGTLESWATAYLATESLEAKLRPPPMPSALASPDKSQRVPRVGRSPALTVAQRSPKTGKLSALRSPLRRARLLHTFLHHEQQAAELMCWALLTFRATPAAFKRGLMHIAADEIRHMQLYAEHLASLGFAYGDHPVNDWLLLRGQTCSTPAQFVATIGLGFEGANLDHTERFAAAFRAVGDEAGARLQELVGREERPHVAFAAYWFRRWEGSLSFEHWAATLPPPLSPMLMRGKPIQRQARVDAGQPEAFVDALQAFKPSARPPDGPQR